MKIQLRQKYWFLWISIALFVLFFLVSLYNATILLSTLSLEGLQWSVKFSLLFNIFYGHFTEVSFQLVITVLIAILFASNTILILAYMQLYKASTVSFFAALSSGSVVTALLGIGCLTCGSLVTAFFATTLGASSLLLALPLGGVEFGLLSLLLLSVSIYVLRKKIAHATMELEP